MKHISDLVSTLQQWYVAQVQSGHEQAYAERFGPQHSLVPKQRSVWIVHGKRQEREYAAFTGTVFVEGDMTDPYLWEYAANGNTFRSFIKGAPLPAAEIDRIRARLDDQGCYIPEAKAKENFYKPNDPLRITKGTLAGNKAICLRHTESEKIFVLTYLLGGMQRLYMPSAWCAYDETAREEHAAVPAKQPGRVRSRRKKRFLRT